MKTHHSTTSRRKRRAPDEHVASIAEREEVAASPAQSLETLRSPDASQEQRGAALTDLQRVVGNAAVERVLAQHDNTKSDTVVQRKAVWRRVNVQLVMRDYRGEPMQGHRIFVEFVSDTGDKTTESASVAGGILTLPRIRLRPRGALRIMAVPEGEAEQAGMLLQGNFSYQLIGGNLTFTVVQGYDITTVTARTQQEAQQQLELSGQVGIPLGPVNLSAGAKNTTTNTSQEGLEQQWQVRIARPDLTITAAGASH